MSSKIPRSLSASAQARGGLRRPIQSDLHEKYTEDSGIVMVSGAGV